MQSEEAWGVVKAAEASLWAVLRPFLTSLKEQAHQWTVRIQRAATERRGDYWDSKYEPEEQQVMRECLEWVAEIAPEWQDSMKGLWPSYDPLGKHADHAILSDGESLIEIEGAIQTWAFNPLERMLARLEEFVGVMLDKRLALGSGSQIYELSPRLFTDAFQPPRYTSLRDGINKSYFSGDLGQVIRAGQERVGQLGRLGNERGDVPSDVAEAIERWVEEGFKLLRGLRVSEHSLDAGRNPADEFLFFVQNWKAYKNPYIDSGVRFAECVLFLGVVYLEEVRKNMPDYIESSAQKSQPQYSITINGGTIYGPVAMRLEAINSSIAGIMKQGTSDLAEALKALESAIIADTDGDDELRQDLLDNLELLANEAKSPPGERKRGVVKSLVTALKNAALSGPEIAKAMEAWGGILNTLI
ncbi:hypothetical protein [Nocardia blacklockiae]|uniref:hypothetical protein n=1 Tax=Nocardia blacklockiae TaxID=480036 RepID=UPI001895D64C|nr:hypothetical protein [Nocardia blacklockiae]MBF6173632.1 hypothetical protein [Nocardia blacklockiae]